MTTTVVLLPSNMCDARLWRELPPGLFGHAQMVHADLAQDATITAMATRTLDSTAGTLLPVGFSMGAIVAVEMAKIAPGRIAGLVLSGYNATADLPERAAHRPLQQSEAAAGGLERLLVEELKPNYLAACHRDDAGMLALLRDMGMLLGTEVFIRQSDALRKRADRRKTLTKLKIPVVIRLRSRRPAVPSRLAPAVAGGSSGIATRHGSRRWSHAAAGAARCFCTGNQAMANR